MKITSPSTSKYLSIQQCKMVFNNNIHNKQDGGALIRADVGVGADFHLRNIIHHLSSSWGNTHLHNLHLHLQCSGAKRRLPSKVLKYLQKCYCIYTHIGARGCSEG